MANDLRGIGHVILGKEASLFVVLCLLSSTLIRIWYTLVVNLEVPFDVNAIAGSTALIAAFILPASLARFFIELGAFTLSRKIAHKPLQKIVASIASASLLLSALALFAGIRGLLNPTACLVVAGISCGVGYELFSLLWYTYFAKLDFDVVKRLFLWRIGIDSIASFLVFAPAAISIAFCFLIPPLTAAGFKRCVTQSSISLSVTHQKPWIHFNPTAHPKLAIGIFVLSMGFAFMQSASHELTLTPATTLSPELSGALLGRFITFAIMFVGLQRQKEIHFDQLFKWGTLIGLLGFLVLLIPTSHAFFLFCAAMVSCAFVIEYTVTLMTIFAAPHIVEPSLRVISWGHLIMRAAGIPILVASVVISLFPFFQVEGSVITYVVVAAVAALVIVGMLLIDSNVVYAFLWGSRSTQQSDMLLGNGLTPRIRQLSTAYKLTEREGEVLQLILEGRSAPYIAETLFISENTAKTHIRHIYKKFNVNSKQELIDSTK